MIIMCIQVATVFPFTVSQSWLIHYSEVFVIISFPRQACYRCFHTSTCYSPSPTLTHPVMAGEWGAQESQHQATLDVCFGRLGAQCCALCHYCALSRWVQVTTHHHHHHQCCYWNMEKSCGNVEINMIHWISIYCKEEKKSCFLYLNSNDKRWQNQVSSYQVCSAEHEELLGPAEAVAAVLDRPRDVVEEGSTSGVSTINSTKSAKLLRDLHHSKHYHHLQDNFQASRVENIRSALLTPHSPLLTHR